MRGIEIGDGAGERDTHKVMQGQVGKVRSLNHFKCNGNALHYKAQSVSLSKSFLYLILPPSTLLSMALLNC